MSILDDLYLSIKKAQTKGNSVELPDFLPHYVHYTRFLIEDKLGIKLTPEEAQQYLYEEGLLPDECYFSKEYIQKWKHTKVNNTGPESRYLKDV